MSTLRVESVQNLAGQEKYMPLFSAPITATGTSVDFSGIPSWATKITVIMNNASLSGSSQFLIQLGNPVIQTTGYASSSGAVSSGTANTTAGISVNTGLVIFAGAPAASFSGTMTIVKLQGSQYIESHATGGNPTVSAHSGGGRVTLPSDATTLRVTTVNGTDTFDSGSFTLMYE